MTDLGHLARGTLHLPAGAAPPVRLAVEDLARYLGRMFGRRPALREAGVPGARLHLVAPGGRAPATPPTLPAGAEWMVEPCEESLAIAGATPRALLAGTYALLEAAGCRWSPYGAAEEHVPAPGAAARTVPPLVGRAAFARRAYASDLATWHYSMPERLAERLPADRAFVDWMAKTGATAFQFIRHANDTQWVIPELLPELARRGLAVESGGHALPELLPRELFGTHPQWFPARADGTRSDDGNVCGATPEALALVRERARIAREASATRDFHLWGLDVFGGGWCACTACRALSPSDQALRVCNAAAEGLEDGRVLHLAYHDTLSPPRTVRPHAAVWAEFAPRERCYGHALDDPDCATNRPYREALERHVELFAGRLEVFEYYGDAILFGGCAVPLTGVLARDLAFYRRAGVHGVSCLVFGAYSLLAHGVNVEAFARGTIDPAAAAAARDLHCARAYGAAAGPMSRYLAALEGLMGSVVSYGDVKLPPRRGASARAARDGLDTALDHVPTVRHRLEEAAGGSASRLAAERQLFDYTVATLAAVRLWLASALVGSDAAAEQALAAMAEAVERARTIDPRLAGSWGAHDLEVTHAFFAGALRAPADFRES